MSSSNVHRLRSLDELLRNRFAGAFAEPTPPDWQAVRSRAAELAGRPSRRRWHVGVLAAATAAVVTVAATAAIGGPPRGVVGVIDFFKSKPAARHARTAFSRMNVLAPSRSAFGDTAQARQIYVFHLANGDHTLSVAPVDSGSFCWTLSDFSNGCQTILSSHGPYKAGEVAPVKIGLIYTDIPTPTMQQAPVQIGGNIRVASATSLQVQFEDGSTTTVPFIWVSRPIDAGFFLYELPRDRWAAGKRPIAVAAFGTNGQLLARVTFSVTSTLEESAGASR
jgi:hypothetical protein